MTPYPVGIHTSMDAATYHALPGASASRLMKLWRSTPAHLHQTLSEPFEPTPEMFIGTLGHALLLEPGKPLPGLWIIPEEYIAADGTKKPWSGNATSCRAKLSEVRERGLIPIKQEAYNHAHAAAKALADHPLIAPVLRDCQTELTLITWDTTNDVGVRCRFDIVPSGPFLADCKFTGQLHDGWPKHAFDMAYHVQAALNLMVWESECGREHPKTGFKFYVVENRPPFDVRVFTCTEEFIQKGREEVCRLLPIYAECERTGVWPGSPAVESECGLPKWA